MTQTATQSAVRHAEIVVPVGVAGLMPHAVRSLNLTPCQRAGLSELRRGLVATGARLERREVSSGADGMLWLLREIARAASRYSEVRELTIKVPLLEDRVLLQSNLAFEPEDDAQQTLARIGAGIDGHEALLSGEIVGNFDGALQWLLERVAIGGRVRGRGLPRPLNARECTLEIPVARFTCAEAGRVEHVDATSRQRTALAELVAGLIGKGAKLPDGSAIQTQETAVLAMLNEIRKVLDQRGEKCFEFADGTRQVTLSLPLRTADLMPDGKVTMALDHENRVLLGRIREALSAMGAPFGAGECVNTVGHAMLWLFDTLALAGGVESPDPCLLSC